MTNDGSPSISNVKRSKPLKYAYEKEIVLYAHHRNLDYFTTECIYSPEAFRGSARALIKNLERVRPSSILDVVRSGEDMARLVPGYAESSCGGACSNERAVNNAEDEVGGCGNSNSNSTVSETARMEQRLQENDKAESQQLEVEITTSKHANLEMANKHPARAKQTDSIAMKRGLVKHASGKQTMSRCERCGYLSSQAVCKACMLLEGLNKNRPKATVVPDNANGGIQQLSGQVAETSLGDG